jgi:alpha-glucosidase (family GH31 glycosyl hydrolase)
MINKFTQMDFLLPSQRLYGFGERVHSFPLEAGTYTMWAQGQDSPVDDGQGRRNLYGVHPFVLVQTSIPGDYIGIFFRNSNAQSPVVGFRSDGQTTLSYITTGSQLEVYFFIHGTAR